MDIRELQEILSICVDEVVRLKEENEKLKVQVAQTTEMVSLMLACEKEFAKRIEKVCEDQGVDKLLINHSVSNLKYEIYDPSIDKSDIYYPQFYDINETLNAIINEKKSLARFGDGEFALMSGVQRQKFQHLDTLLQTRLIEIIKSQEDNLLIAIANHYGSLERFNAAGKQGIRMYMTKEIRIEHREFLNMNRRYHDAYISRPYSLYMDNKTNAPKERFDALKRIWNNRKIIFVEGALTRLGVGNDLFDNALEIKRIEAPAVSSFDRYDEILNAALRFAQNDALFLLALGPTACVLAYDLCKAGYQAVDIGHLDLEYEWFLRGMGGRCEVKNKYNNEFLDGDQVDDEVDEDYLQQIIYATNNNL